MRVYGKEAYKTLVVTRIPNNAGSRQQVLTICARNHGGTPLAIWVARGPRGPGRMRGPGRGAAARGRWGAYLVRRRRRHRTRSSRNPARARPGELSSCSNNGASEKWSMPVDMYSAVRVARGCGEQPRVSERRARRLCSLAGLLPAALPRSARETGLQPAALQGTSPQAPEAGSQSSRTPSAPGPSSTHAHARLGDRLPPGSSWKTGREEGPKRGKGLGFPESGPRKA